MQEILKKSSSGTILTAINKDDFLNLEIPLIDQTIQTQIKGKIKRVFQTKTRVKRASRTGKTSRRSRNRRG